MIIEVDDQKEEAPCGKHYAPLQHTPLPSQNPLSPTDADHYRYSPEPPAQLSSNITLYSNYEDTSSSYDSDNISSYSTSADENESPPLTIEEVITRTHEHKQRVSAINKELQHIFRSPNARKYIATYIAEQQPKFQQRILSTLRKAQRNKLSTALETYLYTLIKTNDTIHFPIEILEKEPPNHWLIALKKQDILAYEPQRNQDTSFVKPLSEALDKLALSFLEDHQKPFFVAILDQLIAHQKAGTNPALILGIAENLIPIPTQQCLLTGITSSTFSLAPSIKPKNPTQPLPPKKLYQRLFEINLSKKIEEKLPAWHFEQQSTLVQILLHKHTQSTPHWDAHLIKKLLKLLQGATYHQAMGTLFFAQYHQATPRQLHQASHNTLRPRSYPLPQEENPFTTFTTQLFIIMLRDRLTHPDSQLSTYLTPTIEKLFYTYPPFWRRYEFADKILTIAASTPLKHTLTQILLLITQYDPKDKTFLPLLFDIIDNKLLPQEFPSFIPLAHL